MIPIGLCLKLVREESGLTLREAAEKIGVSAAFLYNFEEFKTCSNPFMQVKNNPLGIAFEEFFLDNLKNIKTPLLKKYIKKLLDSKSIETNLFQDCFYHSILSFLEFSLVQTIGNYGASYGGLFYILRDLLMFYTDSKDKNIVAVGSINNIFTSFFLKETFNSQWGKKRTKRRKNIYKYDDIIFTPKEDKSIIGYLESKEGNNDFIGRAFYEDRFVSLLFYLLLEKISFSFFIKDTSDHEQKAWDYYNKTVEDIRGRINDNSINILLEPEVYCVLDWRNTPPFRDIFVLDTRFGKVSICCRSLVGGYHYDMFLSWGDILDYS